MIIYLWAATYSLAALIVLLPVGNLFVRAMLKTARLTLVTKAVQSESVGTQPPQSQTARAGRMIGILERILMAIGMIFQRWEVLAAVIALKTVARFREMDEKDFAEYFLVGSLSSMLWTILVTGGWIWFDAHLGATIWADFVQSLTPSK